MTDAHEPEIPPLPLRTLTRSLLVACNRLAHRRILPPAQHRFVAILLSRARFHIPEEEVDDETIKQLCERLVTVYLWFWRALRALERVAPEISRMLPSLPTPRSALEAAGVPERPEDAGMGMARRAVKVLVAACRERGMMSRDDPRWSPWVDRPYALVLYPRTRRGRSALLLRGESVVLSMRFTGTHVRPAHVQVVRPRLLPLGAIDAPHAEIATHFAELVDASAAAVAATFARGPPPSLSHCALVPSRRTPLLPPLMRAGVFEVPPVVAAPLVDGDRPDALVAVLRFNDIRLAAWLRDRPARTPWHRPYHVAHESDDEVDTERAAHDRNDDANVERDGGDR